MSGAVGRFVISSSSEAGRTLVLVPLVETTESEDCRLSRVWSVAEGRLVSSGTIHRTTPPDVVPFRIEHYGIGEPQESVIWVHGNRMTGVAYPSAQLVNLRSAINLKTDGRRGESGPGLKAGMPDGDHLMVVESDVVPIHHDNFGVMGEEAGRPLEGVRSSR